MECSYRRQSLLYNINRAQCASSISQLTQGGVCVALALSESPFLYRSVSLSLKCTLTVQFKAQFKAKDLVGMTMDTAPYHLRVSVLYI